MILPHIIHAICFWNQGLTPKQLVIDVLIINVGVFTFVTGLRCFLFVFHNQSFCRVLWSNNRSCCLVLLFYQAKERKSRFGIFFCRLSRVHVHTTMSHSNNETPSILVDQSTIDIIANQVVLNKQERGP